MEPGTKTLTNNESSENISRRNPDKTETLLPIQWLENNAIATPK